MDEKHYLLHRDAISIHWILLYRFRNVDIVEDCYKNVKLKLGYAHNVKNSHCDWSQVLPRIQDIQDMQNLKKTPKTVYSHNVSNIPLRAVCSMFTLFNLVKFKRSFLGRGIYKSEFILTGHEGSLQSKNKLLTLFVTASFLVFFFN